LCSLWFAPQLLFSYRNTRSNILVWMDES
jgi:hypothetical protein